jgi:hypothetical protein
MQNYQITVKTNEKLRYDKLIKYCKSNFPNFIINTPSQNYCKLCTYSVYNDYENAKKILSNKDLIEEMDHLDPSNFSILYEIKNINILSLFGKNIEKYEEDNMNLLEKELIRKNLYIDKIYYLIDRTGLKISPINAVKIIQNCLDLDNNLFIKIMERCELYQTLCYGISQSKIKKKRYQCFKKILGCFGKGEHDLTALLLIECSYTNEEIDNIINLFKNYGADIKEIEFEMILRLEKSNPESQILLEHKKNL